MKKFILLAIIGVVVFFGFGGMNPPDWTLYVHKDPKFEVTFPTSNAPRIVKFDSRCAEARTVIVGSNHGPFKMDYFETAVVYAILYDGICKFPSHKEMFDAMRGNLTKNYTAKIISQVQIDSFGYQAYLVKAITSEGKIFIFKDFFTEKNDYFSVAVLAPEGKRYTKLINQFIDSFKLL